jgi:hypothetical protein
MAIKPPTVAITATNTASAAAGLRLCPGGSSPMTSTMMRSPAEDQCDARQTRRLVRILPSVADAIWAIRSTHDGVPKPNGPIGHVVRVSSFPGMTRINEFTDGGSFAHADCAPASMRSSLVDRGIDVPITRLEDLAGTTATGTSLTGIFHALKECGLDVELISGEPPAGFVMNPAPGFVADKALFNDYLAASQGAYIRINTPGPWDVPTPAPTDIPALREGEPMHLFEIQDGQGTVMLLIESGAYLHVGTQDDVQAFKASGATGPEPLSAETHAVLMAKYNPTPS